VEVYIAACGARARAEMLFPQSAGAEAVHGEPLGGLNGRLEAGEGLPDDVWVRWLWQTDPEEPVLASVLLNQSHLLGLLVCRHQAMLAGRGRTPVCGGSLAGDEASERIRVVDKRPAEMSLREVRDTVDNLLIEWPRFLQRLADNPRGDENLEAVVGLVDGCLARFGHLAQHPGGADVFDDGGSTEPHDEDGLMRLTRPCLRRTLGSFMVMYRHLHLLGTAEAVAPVPFDCGVCKHHMEASADEFSLLCMNMQLPVAARLNYKHDFPGMYNHVSQVVYFHNAQYERTRRIPLARVPEGDPMHVLPALRQLHPDIALHYEEDRVDLSRGTGRWGWMVVPGRVYLVDPEGRAYHSDNVTSLMRVYLERTGKS
jgi:hypothetical protein